MEKGGSGKTDSARFLLKLDKAELNLTANKPGPHWKRVQQFGPGETVRRRKAF